VSLSAGILTGLLLGIGCGVFFGDWMSGLSVVAEAYIRLLQMAVLPFVTISLVTGLGRLSREQARFMARQGALLLLLLWAIGLTLVMLMPIAFPSWSSGSFFSTSLLEPAKSFDFVSLYIPANPFRSMADNVVPAVVLFSIAVGVALMRVEGRDQLISTLDVLAQALTRVTTFVVSLTPIGVFAIAASASGTMTIADFGRLQVYIVTFGATAMVAAFWILPGLVPVLTPISYRQIIGISRDALITAFSTGSLFVVLPLLVERAKELIAEIAPGDEEAGSVIDVLVPVSFNFPNVGKLLTLGFVLFAVWFSGSSLSLTQYPVLLGSGLLTFFGSTNVAIPFLLDLLRVPADMFQLFVAVGFVNFRFTTLAAVMHTLVLSILSWAAVTGRMHLRVALLVRYLVVSALLLVLVLGGARIFFAATLEGAYSDYELITERAPMIEADPATILSELPPISPHEDLSVPVLERVARRGVLRVGYNEMIPLAYTNESGELVGFEVDLVKRLARDLGVEIELVRTLVEGAVSRLDEGLIDLGLGLVITPDRARQMHFSNYLDLTIAMVVPDHLRDEFATYELARQIEGLTVGVPNSRYYRDVAQQLFPEAETVIVDSPAEFFDSKAGEITAMLHGAEIASAWTLLHPSYSVVVPRPGVRHAMLGYVSARADLEFAAFLEEWIELQKGEGFLDALYHYWIEGRDEQDRKPRWSVIRNVLGWVE
jgi:Na+/H+-dicarboxylate symporter/ABC-type amino acid transport substrate-binding protein